MRCHRPAFVANLRGPKLGLRLRKLLMLRHRKQVFRVLLVDHLEENRLWARAPEIKGEEVEDMEVPAEDSNAKSERICLMN
ncbi:hypothetical protein NL676_018658 [Syzygium grande]|nr:hypothetical protein NL676_018658 [Syzygium grande]